MGGEKSGLLNPSGISVFFPALNDGGTIGSMVLMAIKTLKEITHDYEVIVVNDGSTDYTPEVLRELEQDHVNIRVIHHPSNQGYGAALIHGFAICTKEFVFYTDGDGQYDVRELRDLFAAMRPEIDWVNGYKISRSDPIHRIILGKIYHWIAKLAFGLRVRDVDCDFRLIRRRVFEKVQLHSTSGVICVEMVKKFQDAGFLFAEVPVHHYFRAYGKSQFFNFRRIFRIGFQLIALWFELVIRKKESA
jgi:glycosyltransferase involved in cell wall biosynthesis